MQDPDLDISLPVKKTDWHLLLCRKTQWEVPCWDSSPSSEEEHPCNITDPENTSITSHRYTSTEEVQSPTVIGLHCIQRATTRRVKTLHN